MSNRQERKARKARQREGIDAFVHIRPEKRELLPVPMLGGDPQGNRVQQQNRQSRNEAKRRTRRYSDQPTSVRKELRGPAPEELIQRKLSRGKAYAEKRLAQQKAAETATN